MKKSNEKTYLEAKTELYLGNFEKAADLFEKLIAEGDARAMFDLGQMYLQGKSIPVMSVMRTSSLEETSLKMLLTTVMFWHSTTWVTIS